MKEIKSKPTCLEDNLLKHIGEFDKYVCEFRCYDSRDCEYKLGYDTSNYCVAIRYGYKK